MNNPGVNWFIGVNAAMVRKDISDIGLPVGFPESLIDGFVRWASNQRFNYEADITDEANEYLKNTYAKNLDWINKKNKGKLYARLVCRDGGFCDECQATSDLTIDHIQPRSKGGTDDLKNLRILCRQCNSSKGNR